jgi:L-lactate dehydrogenase
MKATIIGGAGRVGSNAAICLQVGGIVSEIQILDANEEMAEGEALDLMHGSSFVADQRIYAGDYDRAKDSDIFIVTAGLRRKEGESRLDLINRNIGLFSQILDSIVDAGMKDDAIVFVVSNPVDILTYLAVERLDLPVGQVIGLGTVLDTARFRSLIANELNLAPTQVKAYILGEHGDTMLPVWSSATLSGLPIRRLKGFTPELQGKIFERTRQSGMEVIHRKHGAGWAVGVSIAKVVHAIALNTKHTLPITSLQFGCYGIRDVCLSVPTSVGKSGMERHIELELWENEVDGLHASAEALKQMLGKVK